jgi:uncharacterized membrane protein YhaH (DUF805 family)
MRGRILSFDSSAGHGVISGDDGRQYSFSSADILQPRGDISLGLPVDFTPQGTAAGQVQIYVPLTGFTPPRQTSFGPPPDPAYRHPGYAPHWTGPGPGYANDHPPGDASMLEYFKRCFRPYLNGNGRARRKEFWSFFLFGLLTHLPGTILLIAGLSMLNTPLIVSGVALLCLTILACYIPGIGVASRRLHDVGLSGWFYLISLLPYVGGLFLLVVALIPGQRFENQYGPDPKGDLPR